MTMLGLHLLPPVLIVSCDISMTSKCGSMNNVYFRYTNHRVQLKETLFTHSW